MTSYSRLGKSPYLIGFMLAALMAWSLSAITRVMDGALQKTTVELRTPGTNLGTAIQDSAITLKRRVFPPAVVTSDMQGEPRRHLHVGRSARPLREITPPLVVAQTPVSAAQVTAIAGLLTLASVEAKTKKEKLKKKSFASPRSSAERRPSLGGANGSRAGKGSDRSKGGKATKRSSHR